MQYRMDGGIEERCMDGMNGRMEKRWMEDERLQRYKDETIGGKE